LLTAFLMISTNFVFVSFNLSASSLRICRDSLGTPASFSTRSTGSVQTACVCT